MRRERPDREARKQRRIERIGSDEIACPCCGENDWRVLQAHHYFSRRFGPEIIWVCANCHAILSDDQEDFPLPVENGDERLQRIAHFMLNHAALMRLAAEHFAEFAEELVRRAAPDQDNKES